MRSTRKPLALLSAVLVISVAAQLAQAQSIQFSINAQQSNKAISSFIYGANASPTGRWDTITSSRSGGNRLTAYNWENNASNAGSDWYFQNDNLMVWDQPSNVQNVPGQGVRPLLQAAANHNSATILTIPMAGYVSADKLGNGDVRYVNGGSTPDPTYLTTRFKVGLPTDPNRGNNPFPSTPNVNDGYVFQDEFVNWVNKNFPHAITDPKRQVMYDLDNEPDLWSSTHAEVHPNQVTYTELCQKTTDYARAIKAVSPNAMVLGPVSYGWNGYVDLQGAPDKSKGDFINYYLQQMAAAQTTYGKRLVDALDLHYYSEAHGTNGIRVTDDDVSAETVAARLQAPRSLWDTTYTESSWITQWSTYGPIKLLPRMQSKIDANYAGTKIAITEYSFGAGGHISGGIAQADTLGIFGKQGVFAANYWSVSSSDAFIQGAFDMFRNFDGQGGKFGDTSVGATTTDNTNTSIYASTDSTDPNRMVLVALNKTGAPITVTISLNGKHFRYADIFQLTSASSYSQDMGQMNINNLDSFTYTMPAYSVNTLALTPEPATLSLLALGALALVRRRRR